MANTINNFGQFIPTTTLYDLSQIQQVNVNSPEFKELLTRLYQNVNNIAVSLNVKDTGYYLTNEFVTGSLVFSTTNDYNDLRAIYRTTVNFGALPAAGSKSVAHGIPDIVVAGTTTFTFVKIYGAATNPSIPANPFIPIPYVSAGATNNDNLQLDVDATNVTITTGGKDYSAWTRTLITLEYVKQS